MPDHIRFEQSKTNTGVGLSARKSWARLAAAAAATAAESLIIFSGLRLDAPMPLLIGLHFGTTALLAGMAWRQWRMSEDASGMALLALATAGMGPVGAAGMLAALMAMADRRSFATGHERSRQEDPKYEYPDRLHTSIVAQRELLHSSTGLAPFRDALTLGSFKEKQTALAVITRRFDPLFTPALRLALRDQDAAVRVQAATAAARIEDLFLAGQTERLARVSERSDDAGARMAIALHLLGHVEAGLCAPERARSELELALAHLRRAIALDPLRRDIRVAIARVQLHLGDAEEAVHHMASMEQPLSDGEIMVYGEALYWTERWDELRRLFNSIEQRTDISLSLHRIAALWNAPEEACA
jgi:hypothetical protein